MSEYKIDGWDDNEEHKQAVRELLIGRKVVTVQKYEGNPYNYDTKSLIKLDNGVLLEIDGNNGAGGCSSGWYDVVELNTVDNAIMSVEFEKGETDSEWGGINDAFRIFVYSEHEKIKLAEIVGSEGNGYYGSGYYVTVRMSDA